MATKWKRFSRNKTVRIVCNLLLIACIVLGAVFANQFERHLVKYNSKCGDYDFCADELFGDTEFQDEIKENLKMVLTYMMAEVTEDVDAETMKKELDDGLIGMYDYNIAYTDQEGTNHTLSNCKMEDLEDDSVRVKYEGAIRGETYERDWENVFYGPVSILNDEEMYESVDFDWLDVGGLMQEIAGEYPSYRKMIANELVDHLELYKDSLKTFLCYLATKENVTLHTTVEKSTYYKIYGCYPDMAPINVEKEISGVVADCVYDEETGVYIDEENGTFFDPAERRWYDLGVDYKVYEEYANNMKTKLKSIQKVLEKENVKKTEDNKFQLMKEEKENIRKNILTSLAVGYYVENSGETEEADAMDISFSFSTMLKSPTSYSIQFGVNREYVQTRLEPYYDDMEKNRGEISQLNQKLGFYAVCFIIDAVCAGLLVLFLCYVCGRKEDTEEVQLLFFDRWKTEVIVLIGFGIAMCFMFSLENCYHAHINNNQYYVSGQDAKGYGVSLVGVGFCLWLFLQIFYSLVRRAKAATLYKDSILAFLMGRMPKMENQGTLNLKITVMMIGLFVVSIFLVCGTIEAYSDGEAVLYLVVLAVIWLSVFVYVNRGVRKLSIIMDGVKKIRAGELNYQIPTDGKDNRMNQLAQDINSLSDGLENAVDDMLRSERLKTELISNVSHDIKTPLTSIITYVDLLKREDIQPEKAKEYVEVLDQKSQRLKVLTDDLFEAAKASSGAMTTEITKIDIGALFCQAAGEFSEKFEKSQLELRNSIQDNTCFVLADGRLAWRIVENLFSNATKYAQANSRVYVDAEQKDQMIEIVVKNVSAYELNISATELMERFTRGDRSRNTEGSGLGLNIAKSLAELQGGNFFVEIDGDLFKAVLQLPIAQLTTLQK